MILPVIFHNLQGYDSHLFIKQLAKVKGSLSCIPSTGKSIFHFQNRLKLMSINKKGETVTLNFEIRFIDSFKFHQTSLANLVSNRQPSDFKNTNSIIKDNNNILKQKGVYPYDYVSSISKFKETKLPPKEEFYSKISNEYISDEDFQHAINVWNTFNKIITIFTLNQMFYYWLVHLRILEKPV